MDRPDLKIKCNNIARPTLHWWDLSEAEREWFDYVTEPDEFNRFRYRGEVYDLGEFEAATGDIFSLGFDGWQTESAFSAVVVKLFDEDGSLLGWGDEVIVGYAHW